MENFEQKRGDGGRGSRAREGDELTFAVNAERQAYRALNTRNLFQAFAELRPTQVLASHRATLEGVQLELFLLLRPHVRAHRQTIFRMHEANFSMHGKRSIAISHRPFQYIICIKESEGQPPQGN